MNSFGIWVKYKDNAPKCPVEIHANLWHIGKNTDNAFIDFGVMIPQYNNLRCFQIILPFIVPAVNISDLSDTLSQNGIGSLVFNTKCAARVENGVGRRGIKTLCLNDSNEQILLLPIVDDNASYNGISVHFDKVDEFSCIKIDFSNVSHDPIYEKLYLRFRIRDPQIKESMFCKLEKKNRYLESAFTGTQIIDFMVNELRNIKPEVNECMTGGAFELVKLSKVHFFVMEPAENDVTIGDVECRRLEKDWGKYLDNGDYQDNTLVYHWSKKVKEGESFNDYSKLVKVTSSETNWKLISGYVGVVVLLSIFSNYLYQFLCNYFM